MLLLILDFETTGINPSESAPIELGAILYSVEHKTSLAQASTLIPVKSNPCEKINHISVGASQATSKFFDNVLHLIEEWMNQADFFVAHNAEFDKKWLGCCGIPKSSKTWLCTMTDFKWPKATKERSSLVNLALDHGIGVSSAHRSLTDCQLIAALFDRIDNLTMIIDKAIEHEKIPVLRIIARVSYDNRHLAKNAHFHWDGIHKYWYKDIKSCDYRESDYPFRTIEIEQDEELRASAPDVWIYADTYDVGAATLEKYKFEWDEDKKIWIKVESAYLFSESNYPFPVGYD